MTHEEKEEKLHLIQLDWSSHSDAWKIEYAEGVLNKEAKDNFQSILYAFAMQDESGFRQFLEYSCDLEQKYIDEKWEDD